MDVTIPSPEHVQSECCTATAILSRIGDKWSLLIVMMLSGGPRRFNEIKRMVDGISQRMLTLTLRGLERDGLVSRTVYPNIPPKVEYALTALGVSLCEPVSALGRWAVHHKTEIERAQARFDINLEQNS